MRGTAFGATVIRRLKKRYRKELDTSLVHHSYADLFAAVLLSPQNSDKQTNRVTARLFKRFHTFRDYANADPKTLRKELNGLNFYKTKARHLRESAKFIVERHNGRMPHNMNELMGLPGVGRKVANVILSAGFGIANGIAVDTHCITVSKRLGLTRSSNPERIEEDLMSKIPKRYWLYTSNLFIALGRDVCMKREKRCAFCVLNDICPSSTIKGR